MNSRGFICFVFIILNACPLFSSDNSDQKFLIFPIEENININPVIVISGSSEYRKIVQELGTKRKVFLTSKKDTIQLKISQTFESESNSQVVMKSDNKLEEKQVYSLHILNTADSVLSQMKVNNKYYEPDQPPRWRAENLEDKIAPTRVESPRFINSYDHFRPQNNDTVRMATFDLGVIDSSVIYVVVEIRDLTDNKHFQYLYAMKSSKKELSIDQNLCKIVENRPYLIRFNFMDVVGNRSRVSLNWMYFMA